MAKRLVIEDNFRRDREFNYDPPDDTAPLSEKYAFQKRLRHFCEHCLIGDHPFIPFGAPWYATPDGFSPEQQQQIVERQRQRMLRNGR